MEPIDVAFRIFVYASALGLFGAAAWAWWKERRSK